MGSIVDKIRDMEDEKLKQLQDAQERVFKSSVIDHRFMQLYAAALTGVIAHPDSDEHDDNELVTQAYNLANNAYQKVKP